VDRENKRLLLLVEDEAILAMREKLDFEGYGYGVVLAFSGEEAIKAIECEPGIVVIDASIKMALKLCAANRELAESESRLARACFDATNPTTSSPRSAGNRTAKSSMSDRSPPTTRPRAWSMA